MKDAVEDIPEFKWPDPEPLAVAGAERSYPLDALPSVMAEAVREYQAYGQQPVPLVACSALASASLVSQGLADVARDQELSGPISLYNLVVAASGERKTSADRAFSRPIREWMIERCEAHRSDAAEAHAAIAAWEAERDGLLQKIKSASGRKGTGEEADIDVMKRRLARLENSRPSEVILPVLFYEDYTPESLAVDFATGWPSASLWSDEAGLVVGSHAMSDDSLMRYVGLLNRLWDGGTFERGRRTSKKVIIKGRRFTACLMMQPVVLTQLLAACNGASRGMGLIARYCLAWPSSTVGLRLYRAAASGMPAMARLHRRYRELLDIPLPTSGPDMALIPMRLRLTPSAFTVWRDFHDSIEVELRRWGEFDNIPDSGSKIAENAARIAGVFHVIDNGPSGEIDVTTIENAAAVAVWHLNEAKRLIGATEKSQTVLDAELLLEWMIKQPSGPIEPRRILNAGPAPLREKKRRDAAITLLGDTAHLFSDSSGKLFLNPKLLRGPK